MDRRIEVNKDPLRCVCPNCTKVTVYWEHLANRTLHCPECGNCVDENYFQLCKRKEITAEEERQECSNSKTYDRGVLIAHDIHYHDQHYETSYSFPTQGA